MNSAVTLAKYYHWIRYGKVNLVTCFLGLVCYPLLHTVSGFKKRARPVVKSNRDGKNGNFQQEVQSGGVPSEKSISEKSENWCVS